MSTLVGKYGTKMSTVRRIMNCDALLVNCAKEHSNKSNTIATALHVSMQKTTADSQRTGSLTSKARMRPSERSSSVAFKSWDKTMGRSKTRLNDCTVPKMHGLTMSHMTKNSSRSFCQQEHTRGKNGVVPVRR